MDSYNTLWVMWWHFHLLTHRRALLSFSYVILSFRFLCPHIFARASDLTTRKMPCSLSSQSRMPQFSSGDRRRSLTNSHKWELCRPSAGKGQKINRLSEMQYYNHRNNQYSRFVRLCSRSLTTYIWNPFCLQNQVHCLSVSRIKLSATDWPWKGTNSRICLLPQ